MRHVEKTYSSHQEPVWYSNFFVLNCFLFQEYVSNANRNCILPFDLTMSLITLLIRLVNMFCKTILFFQFFLFFSLFLCLLASHLEIACPWNDWLSELPKLCYDGKLRQKVMYTNGFIRNESEVDMWQWIFDRLSLGPGTRSPGDFTKGEGK